MYRLRLCGSQQLTILWTAIGKDAPEPPISFLMTIRDIFTMVGTLEEEREKWWTSPLKRSQRREWEERSENAKLVGLHKVNNSTNSMIESVKARLGGFVKWTLGIHGGLEEVEALIAAK